MNQRGQRERLAEEVAQVMHLPTSSPDAPLPDHVEDRLAAFTELVSTAISNSQARKDLRRLADGQAALRRVATLVAEGAPPAELFETVIGEVGRLVPTDAAALSRYEADDALTIVGSWSNSDEYVPVGTRHALGSGTLARLIVETRRPGRIDSYADASGSLAGAVRDLGWRSSVGAPIIVEGPAIEPTSDALTITARHSETAMSAMISSGAFPNVAFKKPPIPGPVWRARLSVASPISHESGIRAAAASTKTVSSPAASSRSRTTTSGANSSDAMNAPRAMIPPGIARYKSLSRITGRSTVTRRSEPMVPPSVGRGAQPRAAPVGNSVAHRAPGRRRDSLPVSRYARIPATGVGRWSLAVKTQRLSRGILIGSQRHRLERTSRWRRIQSSSSAFGVRGGRRNHEPT